MAFAALLVEKKIFRKVKIGFLMKGHTHEDVDQVFSRYKIVVSFIIFSSASMPVLISLKTGVSYD